MSIEISNTFQTTLTPTGQVGAAHEKERPDRVLQHQARGLGQLSRRGRQHQGRHLRPRDKDGGLLRRGNRRGGAEDAVRLPETEHELHRGHLRRDEAEGVRRPIGVELQDEGDSSPRRAPQPVSVVQRLQGREARFQTQVCTDRKEPFCFPYCQDLILTQQLSSPKHANQAFDSGCHECLSGMGAYAV